MLLTAKDMAIPEIGNYAFFPRLCGTVATGSTSHGLSQPASLSETLHATVAHFDDLDKINITNGGLASPATRTCLSGQGVQSGKSAVFHAYLLTSSSAW